MNTTSHQLINNPQNSFGGASITNLYVPGVQQNYSKGESGGGGSVTQGGVYGLLPIRANSRSTAPIVSIPGTPTNVNATLGTTIGTAVISWTAPGSDVTNYTVTATSGSITSTTNISNTSNTPNTSVTIDRLINGLSYTFTVTASNSAGNSPNSIISNAVIIPETVPGRPFDVKATVGDSRLTIEWKPPNFNGGSEITGYTVSLLTGTFSTTLSGTSVILTNLTNGTMYSFTVVAINKNGESEPSDPSFSIAPGAKPSAPTGVTAIAENGQATVSWAAPLSTGGRVITGYTLIASPGGIRNTTSSTSIVFTGLTNGTAYTFTVISTNELGDSIESTPSLSVTPRTVPPSPTNVIAVAAAGQATITWLPPSSTGGSVITGYTVTSSPGSFTATTNTTSATITGLTNGTSYTFIVVATNVAGNSISSTASTAITPITIPSVPTGVTAVAGDGQATVSWIAPTSTGGSAIAGYTVTSSPSGFTATSSTTSATVTGLTNGTTYTFTVVATNAAGNSVSSTASTAVTPRTIPFAPTGVTAVAGDGQATVSWTAPTSTGGSVITGYTVTSSPIGFTATSSTTSATVTGLTNGTAYTFTVVATNAAGNSVSSTASTAVTPRTVSVAPTGVTAVAGNGQAAVSWIAPTSTGGSAITGYTVTSSPSGFTATSSTTLATVIGLTNGTAYTFTVVATNAAGNSVSSLPSTAITPRTVPLAPTGVTAVAGDGQAVLSWTAPTSTGGSVITGYTVTSSPSGFTATSSTTSAIVTGLTNGTAYTFTVVATNAAGNSVSSTASTAIIPRSVPLAPTGVTAVAGNNQAVVSWTAPTSTGGSAITGYTVTSSPGGFTATSSTTSAIVTGLTNGTAYTFTVVATNTAGNSISSLPSTSVIPIAPPGTPTSVIAVAGNTQATVSWTAPTSTGGSAITLYTVTSNPGSFTATSSTTSATVIGLTNGTAYTFTVVATNATSTSMPSSASAAVTPQPTVPSPPTNIIAVPGNTQITVSWTAPISDGGSTIIQYMTTTNPSTYTMYRSFPTNSATLTGLTNGTAYTVSVSAINAVGSSIAGTSISVTPFIPSVPGPPTNVRVTYLSTDLYPTISWSPPTSDGGGSITKYIVLMYSGGVIVPGSYPGNTAGSARSYLYNTTGISLSNGTTYWFIVRAQNIAGISSDAWALDGFTPR